MPSKNNEVFVVRLWGGWLKLALQLCLCLDLVADSLDSDVDARVRRHGVDAQRNPLVFPL